MNIIYNTLNDFSLKCLENFFTEGVRFCPRQNGEGGYFFFFFFSNIAVVITADAF